MTVRNRQIHILFAFILPLLGILLLLAVSPVAQGSEAGGSFGEARPTETVDLHKLRPASGYSTYTRQPSVKATVSNADDLNFSR